ncbi:metallophosphoesterase family protein [Halomonas aestuarii]|nr:metallophosphoesterase family protein [Halomonas aestuarii]
MTDRRDLTMPELALAGPIGVISDTHGLLRPESLAMLEGCGLILHLGDVGARDEDAGILERLAELAPVHAVRGNIDTAAWAERLPHTQDLRVNGWRLHLVHDIADLAPDVSCDAVLHGHSHKPRNQWQGQRLLFNPGAAGKRRFRLPITMGQLWADERGLRGAILHLPLPVARPGRGQATPG